MAQHLGYPETDGSLPDSPPSAQHVAPTAAAQARVVRLERELSTVGVRLEFRPVPGYFEVENAATGCQWEDLARLCIDHVKSGRPKLDSVIRIVKKKARHEVIE